MRIISKFKDYYDGGQAWGMDRSILYVRETREIKPRDCYRGYDKLNEFYVGFCGKIYAGVAYIKDEITDWHRKCFYSLEAVNEFLEANPNLKPKYYYRYSKYNKYSFDRHFGENAAYRDSHCAETHLKYNSPIFIEDVAGAVTIINPCLKDWEFFRVKDPVTAYIDVMNYVSGVLLSEAKPIPEIDDVTLAECKGFDKWSFRKEPKK